MLDIRYALYIERACRLYSPLSLAYNSFRRCCSLLSLSPPPSPAPTPALLTLPLFSSLASFTCPPDGVANVERAVAVAETGRERESECERGGGAGHRDESYENTCKEIIRKLNKPKTTQLVILEFKLKLSSPHGQRRRQRAAGSSWRSDEVHSMRLRRRLRVKRVRAFGLGCTKCWLTLPYSHSHFHSHSLHSPTLPLSRCALLSLSVLASLWNNFA